MTIYSPNNIGILLHFHCSGERHEREDAPAVAEGIQMLLDCGALRHDDMPGHYRTTDKGKAWVEALCRVEEPRAAWIDAHGNVLTP